MVILGTILGVILGGASGLVSRFVAAVLAAAILVPYKGKQTTITIAFGLAAVIAAAVTVWLLTGLDRDDMPPTMLTVWVALLIVAMSQWLVSGYISRAEAPMG